MRHALRNAVLPCMTLMATNLSGLVCGSFAIETIFSWNGIGTVILVLAEPCRIISRELLYTALTRQVDKIIILVVLLFERSKPLFQPAVLVFEILVLAAKEGDLVERLDERDKHCAHERLEPIDERQDEPLAVGLCGHELRRIGDLIVGAVGKPEFDTVDLLLRGIRALEAKLYFVKLVPLFGKLGLFLE